MPDVQPLDISLAGSPRWVVAAPMSNGDSLWTVALADGWMQTFQVNPAGAVSQVDLLPEQLPPGSPPLLRIDDDVPSLADGHLIVGVGCADGVLRIWGLQPGGAP